MKVYPFIEAERAQQCTVKRACQLLQVSRAAYYAHRTANVAARHRVDEELTEHIRAAHQASKGRSAPHAFTPTCAAAATGTAASVWPG